MTATNDPLTPPIARGAPPAVTVEGDEHTGRRVVALRDIARGEVLSRLGDAQRVPLASRYTVQVDEDAHIDGLWQFTFLNHSCAPNVHVDATAMTIWALRDIRAGEELGYFYPSTEWQMAEPFDCHCGAASCIGRVTGAAALSNDVVARFLMNRHIHALRARS